MVSEEEYPVMVGELNPIESLKRNPNICPFCRSEDTKQGDISHDSGELVMIWDCDECDSAWNAWYALKEYNILLVEGTTPE